MFLVQGMGVRFKPKDIKQSKKWPHALIDQMSLIER
jgi:hypothetical protein